jgi:adenine specific DNA methylase Mod
VEKIKLELPKKYIDESIIIKKEIVYSDEYNSLVEKANEEIKSYRDRQFEAIKQAKNYIHSYSDLPVARSNQ